MERCRPALRAGVLAGLLLLAACAGGPGSPGIAFHLPQEGATLTAPTAVGVSGTGIDSVSFNVDGETLHMATNEPYEWLLDPASLAPGLHELAVQATRAGANFESFVQFIAAADLTLYPIEFVLPADGATVSAATSIAAHGEGLEVAMFKVDGTTAHQDFAPPFQWTLDPRDYEVGERAVAVDAIRAGLVETASVNLLFSPQSSAGQPTGDILKDIQNLKSGEWYEIPDSKLSAVTPTPPPAGNTRSIIGAWSGGAFDTKRNRLVVWGGGHSDYSGNEIYAFSLESFTWTRLTDPSPFPADDPKNKARAVSHPDGRPITRHTYDYLEYIPDPIDRFFSGGGAGLWEDGQFPDRTTWLFDFARNEWEKKSDTPSQGIGALSALGPDGKVYQLGKGAFASYDAGADAWTLLVRDYGWVGYEKTAAIDPKYKKFVATGEGWTLLIDLDNPADELVHLDTKGQKDIEDIRDPGFDYDPLSERLIAWAGGAAVYSLDLSTSSWTKRVTVGVGTTPPSQSPLGTHGRWRYCASLNVFVVVNDINENVFVYRHTR